MAVKKKEPSFEQQLAQLEALADQMETGELPLDELLRAYEEGMKLSSALKRRLSEAKARMSEVKAGKDGTLSVAPAEIVEQVTMLGSEDEP